MAPIDKHGREHQPESFCAWMSGGGPTHLEPSGSRLPFDRRLRDRCEGDSLLMNRFALHMAA